MRIYVQLDDNLTFSADDKGEEELKTVARQSVCRYGRRRMGAVGVPRRIVFSDGLVRVGGFWKRGSGSRAFMTRKTKLYKSENVLSSPILVRPPPSKKHICLNVVADKRVFFILFWYSCVHKLGSKSPRLRTHKCGKRYYGVICTENNEKKSN